MAKVSRQRLRALESGHSPAWPYDARDKQDMTPLIVVNHESCTGCKTCELVCSLSHYGECNPEFCHAKCLTFVSCEESRGTCNANRLTSILKSERFAAAPTEEKWR